MMWPNQRLCCPHLTGEILGRSWPPTVGSDLEQSSLTPSPKHAYGRFHLHHRSRKTQAAPGQTERSRRPIEGNLAVAEVDRFHVQQRCDIAGSAEGHRIRGRMRSSDAKRDDKIAALIRRRFLEAQSVTVMRNCTPVYTDATAKPDRVRGSFRGHGSTGGKEVIGKLVSTFRVWRNSRNLTRFTTLISRYLLRRCTCTIAASAPSEGSGSRAATATPTVHIDIQVHISPESTAEQIDQIFASMARHLYRR